jgi:hypothetical protein
MANIFTRPHNGVMDWVNARAPGMMPVYRKHMTEYYAPKNFNIWYYMGSLADRGAGQPDRDRHLPDDALQAVRGRSVLVGRIHHARRGVGLADPLHAQPPAPRCSSSSVYCTCSAA